MTVEKEQTPEDEISPDNHAWQRRVYSLARINYALMQHDERNVNPDTRSVHVARTSSPHQSDDPELTMLAELFGLWVLDDSSTWIQLLDDSVAITYDTETIVLPHHEIYASDSSTASPFDTLVAKAEEDAEKETSLDGQIERALDNPKQIWARSKTTVVIPSPDTPVDSIRVVRNSEDKHLNQDQQAHQFPVASAQGSHTLAEIDHAFTTQLTERLIDALVYGDKRPEYAEVFDEHARKEIFNYIQQELAASAHQIVDTHSIDLQAESIDLAGRFVPCYTFQFNAVHVVENGDIRLQNTHFSIGEGELENFGPHAPTPDDPHDFVGNTTKRRTVFNQWVANQEEFLGIKGYQEYVLDHLYDLMKAFTTDRYPTLEGSSHSIVLSPDSQGMLRYISAVLERKNVDGTPKLEYSPDTEYDLELRTLAVLLKFIT